jgi:hypothetical protein
MIKALEIVIEKVRKLPEARQVHVAGVLENMMANEVTEIGSFSPKATGQDGNWLGYMRGANGAICDAENTSDLWDAEETIREWDELMAETEFRVTGRTEHGPA